MWHWVFRWSIYWRQALWQRRGGLLMAKLLEPETHVPIEPDSDKAPESEAYVNLVDAAASGAMNGLNMAAAIAAMLMAFIALIALFNGVLGWAGGLVGFQDVTLQGLLGFVLQPLAWTLGVPWEEAQLAGSLIGQKLVLNEFVAYVGYMGVAEQFTPLSKGGGDFRALWLRQFVVDCYFAGWFRGGGAHAARRNFAVWLPGVTGRDTF